MEQNIPEKWKNLKLEFKEDIKQLLREVQEVKLLLAKNQVQ